MFQDIKEQSEILNRRMIDCTMAMEKNNRTSKDKQNTTQKTKD